MNLFTILAASSLFSFGQDDRTELEMPPLQSMRLNLKNASAADVSRKLKALFGDHALVAFDSNSNSVGVLATPARLQLARAYGQELDEEASYCPGVRVIRLQNTNAVETTAKVKALLRLLALFGGDRGVILVAGRDNELIISGTTRKQEQVISLVRLLDVKP
jgi:type II secretory pathway component GspD/PulD (secretin)